MKIEKLQEREQVPCSNLAASLGMLGLLVAVALFGKAADRLLNSEAKAEEARANGYDV